MTLKSGGGGRVRLTDLPPGAGGRPPGETLLLQFVYKSPARGQFAMPAWTCPLDNAGFRQVQLPSPTTVQKHCKGNAEQPC